MTSQIETAQRALFTSFLRGFPEVMHSLIPQWSHLKFLAASLLVVGTLTACTQKTIVESIPNLDRLVSLENCNAHRISATYLDKQGELRTSELLTNSEIQQQCESMAPPVSSARI